jgi:hypothetical protein
MHEALGSTRERERERGRVAGREGTNESHRHSDYKNMEIPEH